MSNRSYIRAGSWRKPYFAGSSDSWNAHTFRTIGRTAGTSRGVAGRISIAG